MAFLFVVTFFSFYQIALTAKPNFIIFNPDEMRAESLNCYGNTLVSTPNFNKFASQGTRFNQCHTTHTVCSPSRTSFMTGWYPHVNGHRTLYHLLQDDEPNLLRYLKQGGYDIMWWGKNDLLAAESFPDSTTEAGNDGGTMNGINPYNNTSPYFYSFLNLAYNGSLELQEDYRNVQSAIQYLQSNPTNPFLIFLPLTKPHPPYSCPEPYYSSVDPSKVNYLRPYNLSGKPDFHQLIPTYRRFNQLSTTQYDQLLRQIQAIYLGSVTYSDYLFGLLMNALENSTFINTTTVFVFADHGDYGGDYGLVEKWPSGLEDVLTRIPMLVRTPGGTSGHVVEEQIQHFDIVPTILNLSNITATHIHFGISMLPQLFGAKGDVNRSVYAEGGYGTNEPRDFEGRCDDPDIPPIDCNPDDIYYPKGLQQQQVPLSVCRSVMIRTPQYKLIFRTDPTDLDHNSELYDLINDPQELKNIYNDISYQDVANDLKNRLFIWQAQTGDVTPYKEDARGFPSRHS